jgi:hypothetical protein
MPTLASSQTTTWDKNKYSKVTFKYAGPDGTGQVTVKQDGGIQSKEVPGYVDLIKSQSGSLSNKTDKTIDYDLS